MKTPATFSIYKIMGFLKDYFAGLTGKTTPVNADSLTITDSEDSNASKKLSFTNLKAFLKSYFDGLYASVSGGSETATTLGSLINSAGAATPNDTDLVATAESGGLLKKITWTAIKTFLSATFATRTYAESLVVGLIDDRGNFDASGNAFPSSGGSGSAGAILKGDLWTISVAGTLGGHPVTAGDLVRALVDTPGTTDANWAITENNIGYVAENSSNKSTDVNADQASNTKYPSVKSVYDWAVALFQPKDSDLTTIAGLTATTDNFLQAKSSAWASRTVAQVSADLQGDGLTSTSVGFRTIPQNSQSTAYTTVADDAGRHILHPSADTNARTFTIDSNANVAYPVGTAITFINQTSQVVTIAITSDTLTLANTTTTGSRSLAQNGVATAIKITSTSWIISGTGLT